ncbi:MAG: DUF4215 domain-containing protein [archaeon]|nr:DUF4215 domain-containing protein [archaeon]
MKRISIIAIVKTKKGKEVTLSVADSIELNYLGTQVTIQKLNTICGNKKIEVGEECDDGNLNNKDGCSSQCKLESCMEQSGYVCETEKICSATTLKTNNLTQVCCNKICSTPLKTNCSNCGLMCTKDDCNSILESCYFEGGWSNTCTSCSSITCDEYKTQTDCNDDNCLKGCEWSSASGKCILEQDCGNDNLETGEQCDNGVENTNTVCTPSYGGSCSYCNTTCSLKTVGVSCGDGIKQEVEQCDNGTLNTNTACSPACGTTCYYCDTTCTQKSVVGSSCTKANGQTCTLGTQCISGNCVDGYCCASASCPTCKSCGISGSEGTCTNVGYGEQTIGCSDPTLNRNLVCVAGICNQLMWHYLNEDQTILTDSCSYPEDAKQCTLSFTGNYGWSSNYLLNPPPYWFSLYWMSYKRCQPWNSNTTVTVYKYFCDIFPA